MAAVTRRAVLGWLAGVGGWLVAGRADAKRRPKPRTSVYTNVYPNTY